MKYLAIGVFLSLCSVFLSKILWGMEKIYVVPGAVGCIFIVISMVFSGSMTSGDRMRANFATETTEHRDERHKITINSLYIALPNIIVAVLFYYVNK
ncbi:DUF5316 domain-containing protein [Lysinibacillus sp. M3]|uniref:DUF5316 domain-containing protein n=1 Tax=Lysinibacillus zambalensis TaxID=3160866 RepID=A0ABV1MM34_9BACI